MSDCSVCWVTVVEATFAADDNKSVGGIARVARTEGEVVLDDKTQLRLCSNGASTAQLSALVNHIYPGRASATGNERISKQASGTLPEIIEALGLSPAAK
ncbi:MAG TPA: hypothetical protein VGC86_18110 [Afipia sp.]